MKAARKILLIAILYCLIFKAEFVFIPHSINFSFGIVGILLYVLDRTTRRRILQSSNAYIQPLLKYTVPFVLVSCISSLINNSTDFFYLKYGLSLILTYYATYIAAYLFFKIYNEITVERVIKYLFIVTLLYLVIATVMFLNPSVNDLLMASIRLDSIAEIKLDINIGWRLVGLGVQFYTAGLVLGCMLILLAFYISSFGLNVWKKIFYIVSYVVITTIGMMVARTTIVGSGIGLMVIIFSSLKNQKHRFKNMVSLFFAFIILLTIYDSIQSSFLNDYDSLMDFGFSIFSDMSSSGLRNDHSLGRMFEMYKNLPDNNKTWLIGDALWNIEDHYYKNVDIGYLRNIYYFGLLGMGALLFYYNGILQLIFSKSGLFGTNSKLAVFSFFLYILALQFKGPADMFYYVVPFYFCFKS